jgi:hypothetical protein
MPQITDNTNGSMIGRCLVYYRDGDHEAWQSVGLPLSLSAVREAIACNTRRNKGHSQYRLEPVEATEADWKARDEELEVKLRAEKRERGGTSGTS